MNSFTTLLSALAAGKSLQVMSAGQWVNLSTEGALRHLIPIINIGVTNSVRVKPETQEIFQERLFLDKKYKIKLTVLEGVVTKLELAE